VEEEAVKARRSIGVPDLAAAACRIREALPGAVLHPRSITVSDGVTYALAMLPAGERLVALGRRGCARELEPEDRHRVARDEIAVCLLSHANAEAIRRLLSFTAPQPLGKIDATIGLGDRLGAAGAGHIAAIRGFRAAPVLAQQSVRELTLTGRTYADVLDSSTWAVLREGYREPWGADGDHLKTPEWVASALSTGLSMITADVSDFLHGEFARRADSEVHAAYAALDPAWRRELDARYLSTGFPAGDTTVRFTTAELERTALVYREAVTQAARLYRAGVEVRGRAGFDFELSIDETETPTTPQAHLFMATELRRAGVPFTSLAPRFVGEFQKAIDYIGSVPEFEASFAVHAAIAARGGYRISVHSGSDKFSVFPSVGRLSGGRFHLKTAGTSWLEALRVVAAADAELFRAIYAAALEKYAEARKLYHVTPRGLARREARRS
jgi:hypothetical protein